MSFSALDIFPISLALLFLCRVQPVQPLKSFNENYLGLVPCRSARGFMAMFVVLHHLSQQSAGGLIMPQFLYFGNLPVSVFFFLSGFGLMKRYTQSCDYKKNFLALHLPPLLIPLLFSLVCFKLIYRITGNPQTFRALFDQIMDGGLVLVILWYMLVIIIFYLAFNLSMILAKGRAKRVLLYMSIFCLLYQLLGHFGGYGQWLYNTCHLFVLGMFWSLYEEHILTFIRRFYWPSLLSCGLIFIVTWLGFDRLYALWPSEHMRLLISLVRNPAFTLSFVLLTMKLRFENPILDFLGRISLELYVLHPLFLMFFRNSILYVESDPLFCLAVITASVAAAWLLSMPYKLCIRKYTRLIKA